MNIPGVWRGSIWTWRWRRWRITVSMSARATCVCSEYGACGFPVVCSDIDPYRGVLPVTRVRNRAEDWLEAIRAHLAEPDASRRQGVELRARVREEWLLTADAALAWGRPGCRIEEGARRSRTFFIHALPRLGRSARASSVGARGRLVLLAIRTTIADDRRQAGSYGFGVHMRLSGGVT